MSELDWGFTYWQVKPTSGKYRQLMLQLKDEFLYPSSGGKLRYFCATLYEQSVTHEDNPRVLFTLDQTADAGAPTIPPEAIIELGEIVRKWSEALKNAKESNIATP